jgi:hypothetical protein
MISSGVTGTWYRSKLFQLEIYGIPYMKKSRNSVKFRGISRNYTSRNSAEFRRNFSQFRTEYGIDGSKKNRRNSVSTEFRGHPMYVVGQPSRVQNSFGTPVLNFFKIRDVHSYVRTMYIVIHIF